jgi:succinoglycan biosynthesis protein ExoA
MTQKIKISHFDHEPMVSIVMAVRNEGEFIGRCLRAILKQKYNSNKMEIIIADGMSTDSTRKIISKILTEKPQHLKIILLNNENKIVSTGLNQAILNSKGEILIRVDGHTIIATDYVRQCVKALKASGAENVGGKMHAIGRNYFGNAVSLATSSSFGIGGAKFHVSDRTEWVDTVYLGAWPRSVFLKIGLFDEELKRNQDDELNYRLRAFGGKILLSKDIKSKYYNRSTPLSLWSQYFQYGFWKVRVLQKNPKQMQIRQFVPPIFVMSLILTLILSLLLAKGFLLFMFILGSYVIVNMLASIIATFQGNIKYLPVFPITYAILQIGYGFGFLFGIIKFYDKWGKKSNDTPKLIE